MNYDVKIIYRLHQDVCSHGFGIYKIKYVGSERFYWAPKKEEWVGPFKPYEIWTPEPLFVIESEAMRQVAEEISNMGFAPSELSSKAGELTATKEHLADMRRLVFEVPEPRITIRENNN